MWYLVDNRRPTFEVSAPHLGGQPQPHNTASRFADAVPGQSDDLYTCSQGQNFARDRTRQPLILQM